MPFWGVALNTGAGLFGGLKPDITLNYGPKENAVLASAEGLARYRAYVAGGMTDGEASALAVGDVYGDKFADQKAARKKWLSISSGKDSPEISPVPKVGLLDKIGEGVNKIFGGVANSASRTAGKEAGESFAGKVMPFLIFGGVAVLAILLIGRKK